MKKFLLILLIIINITNVGTLYKASEIEEKTILPSNTNFISDFTNHNAIVSNNGSMDYKMTNWNNYFTGYDFEGNKNSWWTFFNEGLLTNQNALVSARSTSPIQGISDGWMIEGALNFDGSSDGVAFGISIDGNYTPVVGSKTLGFYDYNNTQTGFNGFVIELDNKYDGADVEGFQENVGKHLSISYVKNGQIDPSLVKYVSIQNLINDSKIRVVYVPAEYSPNGKNQLYAGYTQFVKPNGYIDPVSVTLEGTEVDNLRNNNQYLYFNVTGVNQNGVSNASSFIVSANQPILGQVETDIQTTIRDENNNIINSANAGQTIIVEHVIGNTMKLPFKINAHLDLQSLFNETNKNIALEGKNVTIDGLPVNDFTTSQPLDVTVPHEGNKTVIRYNVTIPTTSQTTKTSVVVQLKGNKIVTNSNSTNLLVNDINTVVGKDFSISAKNMFVNSIIQADSWVNNDNELIKQAQAQAWKNIDMSTAEVNVETKPNSITASGVYDITFNVVEEPNTKISVKLIVSDPIDSVVGANYTIRANNVVVNSVSEANSILLDDNQLLNKADVKAWNNITGDNAEVVVTNKPTTITEGGVYDLIFSVVQEPETKINVKMIVKDSDTVCIGDVCLIAKNFKINLSEIQIPGGVNEEQIKKLAQLKAFDLNGNDRTDEVKLDPTDLNKINSQTAGGIVSDITFTLGNAKKDVNATIIDDITYTINAKNFAVSVKDAQSLTADLVKLPDSANVSVSPIGNIDDVLVNPTQLAMIQNAVVGQYPLTFTYKGVTKEITVTVYDDSTNTDNDANKDKANIFLTADSQVKLRTNSSKNNQSLKTVDDFNKDIVSGTNAKSWLLDGTAATVQEASGSQTVLDQPGLYIVKLHGVSGGYKTSVKDVYVTVVDDNTSCNDKVCIVASDFDQNLTEVAQLTEDKAKVKANVKAFYIDQVGTPTVSVNQTQLGAIQGLTQMPNTNPMNLTFSAEGLDAPVKVTIVDNNYTLSANNFNVNVADLPLDEAGVVNKANATATNNATHALGTVKVDQTSLNKLNATTEGVVDVTLYVDEQPTVTATIKVNVVPDGAVVGDKATIVADSPIEINLSDVLSDVVKRDKGDLFDIIKNKANARAWYNDGTKPDPTIIYDENQMNNILAQKAPAKDLDFTFIVDGDNKAKKPIKVNIVDDTTITLPGQDGNLGTDDDVVVKPNPDGNGNYPTTKPDGSVDLPNGGDISFPNKPDAGMEVPGGSNVGQDGTVTAPNGDQSRPNMDGTITVPGHDNQFGTEDDGIIKPNGPNKPVVNPDGTITLPDGGVITFPGLSDCEIVIEPTGYVDSRGVVTNPGADGIINTADDVVLDPAVVCNVVVTEPQQPTKLEATHTGSASNVMMLFVTIAISSVVVIVLKRRK